MASFYYKFMALGSIAIGLASFPLCFELNTVFWFNDVMVTTEIPPPEDLETILETGAWAWNWMEPPLGQLSFFLLTVQFTREQLDKLDQPTYHERMLESRSEELAAKYNRFHPSIVKAFSKSEPFIK